jgi:hypothetical protein
LLDPERVHIGHDGYVQVCQGFSIGNLYGSSLHDILERHQKDPSELVLLTARDGPYGLATKVAPHLLQSKYTDACQLCFLARMAAMDQHPSTFAPRLIYQL